MTEYTVTTKVLSADGETPERVTFFVRDNGGYVRYWDARGEAKQICERLRAGGNTLIARDRTLKRVIQSELAKARYDARKESRLR